MTLSSVCGRLIWTLPGAFQQSVKIDTVTAHFNCLDQMTIFFIKFKSSGRKYGPCLPDEAQLVLNGKIIQIL